MDETSKLLKPTYRKLKSGGMAVEEKICHNFGFCGQDCTSARPESIPTEAVFLSNVITRLNNVRILRLYNLAGHVENESCCEPNFLLGVVRAPVHFFVGTEKHQSFLWRKCFEGVLNRLSTVLTVSKPLIVTTFSTNLLDGKTIDTEFVWNRT